MRTGVDIPAYTFPFLFYFLFFLRTGVDIQADIHLSRRTLPHTPSQPASH
jgi:hypothetical protein